MPSARRQAAITGMGIVSCLGSSLDAVAAALRAGRSGIVLDSDRRKAGFRSALTGKVQGFDPLERGLSRKMLRTMCEPAQYAYAAANDAIADAGLRPQDLRSDRCGIVLGNDSCVKGAVDSIDIVREHGETHFIGGGHIFRAMNSTATMNLAALLGLRGASWTLSAACASGSHAIGQALMLIRSGLQDLVLTGGAQETNWYSMASFDALEAFSRRESEPEKASRPFDAERDGLVPSGGAACLVVEELEHARRRGARIYAVVGGYGFSCDGAHLCQPEADGMTRAIRMALADAGTGAGEIDYVNAHATSTPIGDISEARALRAVFPDSATHPAVSSTKALTGHGLSLAGAMETAFCAVALREGFIPGSAHLVNLDPACAGLNIIRATLPQPPHVVLNNSSGFGGANVCLVLRRE
jgi:3-oxoacyl-[acyl-carrier-protein] synthase-1